MKPLSVALIVAGCFTACQNSPIGPGSGAPVISSVQVRGPREVPPGQTVQVSLIATLTDGTTRDVTNEADWTVGHSHVASIAAPGLITGVEIGTAMIEAQTDGHRARKELHVLPAGTYLLTGRLIEPGSRNVSVHGALIEITTGTGTGLAATTNAEGEFSLYGVAGQTTVRATKDGYGPLTRLVDVTGHHTITLELPVAGGRADISGIYTLTIAAASECGVGFGAAHLPEDVRLRSYIAAVQQTGPTFWVTLGASGVPADFHQGFYGVAQPEGALFAIRNPDDGQPIFERLFGSTIFTFGGSAVVAIGQGEKFGGTLSGELRVSEIGSPWRPLAWCSSTHHQFVLSR